jgi:hypothetical protein
MFCLDVYLFGYRFLYERPMRAELIKVVYDQ